MRRLLREGFGLFHFFHRRARWRETGEENRDQLGSVILVIFRSEKRAQDRDAAKPRQSSRLFAQAVLKQTGKQKRSAKAGVHLGLHSVRLNSGDLIGRDL